MKLLKFDSYEKYVQTQRSTQRKRGTGPFFTDHEFVRIANWLREHGIEGPLRGICHGARNGMEADELVKNFPGSDVFGTDLFPYTNSTLRKRGLSEVIAHDFSVQKDEWVGAFDVVYTNSLDHARDPVQAMSVWLEQLKLTGYLFIQTIPLTSSKGHTHKGDCFFGELTELMEMANKLGILLDLLYCDTTRHKKTRLNRRAWRSVVLIIKSKEKE